MIRLSKLADYGIVMMTHMARQPDRQHTAPEIAAQSHLPLPTASKILKGLVRAGLLTSHRGVKGGYGLARPVSAISVADVIVALEGPIALTTCIEHAPGECEIEALCPARANWHRINDAIRHALEGITMAEMALTLPAAFGAPLGAFADRPALSEARHQANGDPAAAGSRRIAAHAK
ncbi:MAG TPA: SUF system Fe-S cluster assembly regulator [Geminicoccaceae bacterium]|nr:SUF system Fe-S cluster assembly regulator [Geminicoccaceae bacterium]